MTNDELDKLKALAERAKKCLGDICDCNGEFHAAVSPDVVLELIAHIRSQEAEVERLQSNLTEMEAIAKSWMEDCDKLQEKYEPQSVVLSGNLNESLRAQLAEAREVIQFYAEMRFNREKMEWMPGGPDKARAYIARYASDASLEKYK
jgi:hypothetical protein